MLLSQQQQVGVGVGVGWVISLLKTFWGIFWLPYFYRLHFISVWQPYFIIHLSVFPSPFPSFPHSLFLLLCPLLCSGKECVKSLHAVYDKLYVAGNSDIVVKAHMEYLLKCYIMYKETVMVWNKAVILIWLAVEPIEYNDRKRFKWLCLPARLHKLCVDLSTERRRTRWFRQCNRAC